MTIIPRPIIFSQRKDARGRLQFADLGQGFVRVFSISDVPEGVVRGGHAHRTCSQFLFCSVGTVRGKLAYPDYRKGLSIVLSDDEEIGGVGVLVPPLVWIVLDQFSPGAVLTVLATEKYSPPITDFAELEKLWASI